ncbi:MAG: hypothetical protein ACLGIJ_06175 [Candidatus Limnocylindria bacterium]
MGAVVVALAVLAGLGLAIAKPWGEGRPDDPAAVGPSQTASAPTLAPSPEPAAPVLLDPADPWLTVGLLDAVEPRDRWGISALLDGRPSGSLIPAFTEVWQRAVPTAGGPVAPLILRAPGPVRALAITAPPDDIPLDVRAWTRLTGGGWGWLLVARSASGHPAALPVLLPPSGFDGPLDRWPAGRYRIDLLMGDRVQRIDITLDIEADPASEAATGSERLVALAVPVVEGAAAAASWLALDDPPSDRVRLIPEPPPLLAAARRFAPFAGTPGVALDPVDAGGPSWFEAASETIGCDPESPVGSVEVLGITHPVGSPPTSIELRDGPPRRFAAFDLRATREVVPGLTLVVLASGQPVPEGVHRLELEGLEGTRTFRVCIGPSDP